MKTATRYFLRIIIILPLLALLAGGGWYFFKLRPERLAVEELARLSAQVEPLLRAETMESGRLLASLEQLRPLEADYAPGQELLRGATSFVTGDLRNAALHLASANKLVPENAALYSFLAATHLRQGNTALAQELYLQALPRKSRDAYSALSLTADQLGLASTFFTFHQPLKALPLAEEAFRTRHKYLSSDHPDTMNAANRLATIYVALQRDQEATALLMDTYLRAAKKNPQPTAQLEETKILLTILYNQSGRGAELQDFLAQHELLAATTIRAIVEQPSKLAADPSLITPTIPPPTDAPLGLHEDKPSAPQETAPLLSAEAKVTEAAVPTVAPEADETSPVEAPATMEADEAELMAELLEKSVEADPPPTEIFATEMMTFELAPLAPSPEEAGSPKTIDVLISEVTTPLGELATSPKPEAPKEPEGIVAAKPIDEAELTRWTDLTKRLTGSDDALAVEMWTKIFTARQDVLGQNPRQAQWNPERRALIRSYLGTEAYEPAIYELSALLDGELDQKSDEFVDLTSLFAAALEGKHLLLAAEKQWHTAADIVDGRLEAQLESRSQKVNPKDVRLSLQTHLKLAENYQKQNRVKQEAEIELRATLGRFGKMDLSPYPEAVLVNLELARLIWGLKRPREATRYYEKAILLAEEYLKNPADEEKEKVLWWLEAAQSDLKLLKAKKAKPAQAPTREFLPTKEQLKAQVMALDILGRKAEAEARMSASLKKAVDRYGAESSLAWDYYSLGLTQLADEGRLKELTAVVTQKPDQVPEGGSISWQIKSLIFAAGANENAGQLAVAAELYQKAGELLEAQPPNTLAQERLEVMEATRRLGPLPTDPGASPAEFDDNYWQVPETQAQ